jgi:hypothetical protein
MEKQRKELFSALEKRDSSALIAFVQKTVRFDSYVLIFCLPASRNQKPIL